MTENQFEKAVPIFNSLIDTQRDFVMLDRFKEALKSYKGNKPLVTIQFQIKGGEHIKLEELPGESLDSLIDFCIIQKEKTLSAYQKELEAI